VFPENTSIATGHRRDQLRFAAGLRRDEPVEIDSPEGAQDGPYMSVGQAADDFEIVLLGGQGLARQASAHGFDQVIGQVREIPDGQMLDLAVFPEGVPEQVGDVRLPVMLTSDCGYMDGAFVFAHGGLSKTFARAAQPP
jgi:hypothetical protein